MPLEADLRNPPPGALPAFGPPFVRFAHEEFARLHREMARLGDALRPREQQVVRLGSVELDGSGDGTVTIDVSKPDFEFFLHRLYVTDLAASFGSPVTGGYLNIVCGGQIEDGLNLATNGLPQVFTSGDDQAIVFEDGQQLQVQVVGATAYHAISVVARGRLVRSHTALDEP